MNHEDEMREVEARTTPGRDPRVEEMSRQGSAPAPADEREVGQAREANRPVQADRAEHEPRAEHELRTEHEPRADHEPHADQQPYDRGPASGETMLGAYRSRFADAQARFIDDPKGAVEQARSVLEEAVDRFMAALHDQAGDGDDTERMRLAMRRYRQVFESLAETGRR